MLHLSDTLSYLLHYRFKSHIQNILLSYKTCCLLQIELSNLAIKKLNSTKVTFLTE